MGVNTSLFITLLSIIFSRQHSFPLPQQAKLHLGNGETWKSICQEENKLSKASLTLTLSLSLALSLALALALAFALALALTLALWAEKEIASQTGKEKKERKKNLGNGVRVGRGKPDLVEKKGLFICITTLACACTSNSLQ